jgi:serine/threonine-protein kinase
MNFQPGERVGDYEIVQVLGTGGMGEVYKVRNVLSDRVEAMKVLLRSLADAPELADRFLQEIRVQASLDHPNIASLRTALKVNDHLLMIMEFVEGSGLDQRVLDGPIPVDTATGYILQTLSALDYAHSRGVIHRDIKPSNMMLTAHGTIKLMDFGIARAMQNRRLTMTGMTVGSINYMAPEQIRGDNADARSDMYSVGVTFYELVTGRPLFDGDSNYEIMSAHITMPPKPPEHVNPAVPPGLSRVILRALEKDPEKRFQTARAFSAALEQAREGFGQPATANTPPPYVQASRRPTLFDSPTAAVPSPQRTTQFELPTIGMPMPTSASRAATSPVNLIFVAVLLLVGAAIAWLVSAHSGMWLGIGLAIASVLTGTYFLLSQRQGQPTAPPDHGLTDTSPIPAPPKPSAKPGTLSDTIAFRAPPQPPSSPPLSPVAVGGDETSTRIFQTLPQPPSDAAGAAAVQAPMATAPAERVEEYTRMFRVGDPKGPSVEAAAVNLGGGRLSHFLVSGLRLDRQAV